MIYSHFEVMHHFRATLQLVNSQVIELENCSNPQKSSSSDC